MISIKEISRLSGYSKTTVSRALNNYSDINPETKEKILQICREHDYVPSALGRSLSTKRTFTVGVVFSEYSNQGLTHPFFSELLNEIKNQISPYGYDILLIGNKIGEFVHSYLKHCEQKAVDGVIVLSAYETDPEIIELLTSNIPTVVMQSFHEGKACYLCDNEKAIETMVEYVLNQGHKKIGFVRGDQDANSGKERYDAFLKAVEKFGIDYHPEWIFDGKYYTIEEGRKACEEMLKLDDRPTCLVCSSDTLALGCMIEMLAKGYKIPEDLSLTGFDNIPMSKMFSKELTTIDQDIKSFASNAVASLVKQINGDKDIVSKNIIPCIMVNGETVKKIN
jgi:LacI family transcriptional regulator